MSDWVQVHKSLFDHWIVDFNDAGKALAWIDLISMANHAPGDVMIKNRVVHLDRGQSCCSQITLQKRWKWSQNKVKRFLLVLEKNEMIDFKTNELTTVITICNYNTFQNESETANDHTNDHTNDQTNDPIIPKSAPKTRKKNTAKPLDYSSWPCIPSDQILSDYKALRKTKRASFTQTVIDSMGKHLVELSAKGIDVDQTLSICCERGWQGLKADWVINHLQKNPTGNGNQPLCRQEKVEAHNKAVFDEFVAGEKIGDIYTEYEQVQPKQIGD